MAILATLRRSGGISALSRQLGEAPTETMAAADALLPALLTDFQNYSGGMAGLLELVDQAGGGAMAQQIMSGEPVDIRPGEMILARVQQLDMPERSGTDVTVPASPDLHRRMLPLLAMLLGGYLSARATSGGLDMAELSALLDARKTFYSSGDEHV